jgi:WD40 repeat protein
MRLLTCWLSVVLVGSSGGAVASAQAVEPARGSLAKKPRFILNDHKDVVWCVAFAPDGKSLASCAGNRSAKAGELRGYDLTTGKPARTFVAEEPHGIRWVAFAPSGKTLAAAEYDGMVRIRDAATGKVQSAFNRRTER